jgi:hypothetical protein
MNAHSLIAKMVEKGAPVLFADTCSILDLMRDPTRGSVLESDRRAAVALLVAMENSSRLSGIVAEQVVLEMNENAQAVEVETTNAIGSLASNLARLDALHGIYGGTGASSVIHLQDHTVRARRVFDRWVAASMQVPTPGAGYKRAMDRINQAGEPRAPARKGKDSIKDCVVIETYLEAAFLLRQAGLASTFVFLSSNTRDYRDTGSTKLRPELQVDFGPSRIDYASNYGHAQHLLGI